MIRIGTCMAVLALCAAAQEPYQYKPRGGHIDWSNNFEAGLRKARREYRPVILYFTHDR